VGSLKPRRQIFDLRKPRLRTGAAVTRDEPRKNPLAKERRTTFEALTIEGGEYLVAEGQFECRNEGVLRVTERLPRVAEPPCRCSDRPSGNARCIEGGETLSHPRTLVASIDIRRVFNKGDSALGDR